MEIKKMNIGEDCIDIVSESGDTRHGFKHTSTLFINGYEVSTGKCYYLNRAWERYRYQTSMIEAVMVAINSRVERIKDNYKYVNNISRIVGKRKEEVQTIIDNDDEVKLLKEVIERLK